MKTKIFVLFLIVNTTFAQLMYLELNSGVTTPLNYIFPTNWSGGNVVAAWVCGDGGVVLKTTSSGGSFINVGVNGIPNNINMNTIASNRDNSLIALTAGVRNDTAIVYRTSNGGTNWAVVFRQFGSSINGIFFNNTNGLMVGNPVGGRWSVWKINNEGLTFDSAGMFIPQNANESGFRNSIDIYSNYTSIFFGTNNSRVYYTTNSGLNWLFMTIPNDTNIYSMHFPNSGNTGYIGTSSKVYYTSNFGLNWSDLGTVPGSGYISGLVACPVPVQGIGSHELMVTRNDSTIYRYYPWGSMWFNAYSAPSGKYKYVSKYYTGWMIYAVRDNGGISWGSCGTGGIQRISEIIPVEYTLMQNYPNPFNPETRIRFDVPVKSSIRISVFDVLGREVIRLAEQNFLPGEYELSWDASNYPSGIYFYSMITENYTKTKKMILIK